MVQTVVSSVKTPAACFKYAASRAYFAQSNCHPMATYLSHSREGSQPTSHCGQMTGIILFFLAPTLGYWVHQCTVLICDSVTSSC